MTHGNEMIINNNKKKFIYHKLANDEGALIMMCGRNEEFQLGAAVH
jgi:hypothetical protein